MDFPEKEVCVFLRFMSYAIFFVSAVAVAQLGFMAQRASNHIGHP